MATIKRSLISSGVLFAVLITLKFSDAGEIYTDKVAKKEFTSMRNNVNATMLTEQSPIDYWYTLEEGFMNMVQPTKLTVAFVIQTYEKFSGPNYSSTTIGDFLGESEVVGILVLFIIGVLYCAGIVIGGLIFCACQCCCSGYQKYDRTGAKCSRFTMSFFLLSFCVLISFGTGMLGMSLKDIIRTTDHWPDFVNTSFNSVDGVLVNTQKDINFIAKEGFREVDRQIMVDIDGADKYIFQGLNSHMSVLIMATLDDMASIGNNLPMISTKLQEIINLKDNMVNVTLANSWGPMHDISSDLTSICNTIGVPKCLTAGINIATLNLPTEEYDSYGFDAVESLRNLTTLIQTSNAAAASSNQSYNSIPNRVKEKIGPVKLTLQGKFTTIKNSIDGYMQNIKTEVESIQSEIRPVREDIYTSSTYPRDYRSYVNYGIIALMTVFGVLAGSILLATCMGAMAFQKEVLPTKRSGCVRASGCCLIIVVYVSLVLSWIFMLVTMSLFVAGTQVQSAVCPILQGERDNFTSIQQIMNYVESHHVAPPQNSTVSFYNISQILTECRNNATFYTSFRLDTVFDLKQLQIQLDNAAIPTQLAGLNIDTSTMEIFGVNAENNVAQVIAQMKEINFTAFLAALNADGKDYFFNLLNSAAANVTTFAGSGQVTQEDSDELKKIATRLQTLADGSVRAFENERYKLSSVDLPNITAQIQAMVVLSEKVLKDGVKLRDRLSPTFTSVVRDFGMREQAIGQAFVTDSTKMIKNEVGQCRPLYQVYSNGVTLLCRDTLPPVNGIWFSLGLILITLLFTIFVSACLSKHYKRARKTDNQRIQINTVTHTTFNQKQQQRNYAYANSADHKV